MVLSLHMCFMIIKYQHKLTQKVLSCWRIQKVGQYVTISSHRLNHKAKSRQKQLFHGPYKQILKSKSKNYIMQPMDIYTDQYQSPSYILDSKVFTFVFISFYYLIFVYINMAEPQRRRKKTKTKKMKKKKKKKELKKRRRGLGRNWKNSNSVDMTTIRA